MTSGPKLAHGAPGAVSADLAAEVVFLGLVAAVFVYFLVDARSWPIGAALLPTVAASAGMVLLGFWADAEFQFKPSQWMGKSGGIPEYPTIPAARELRDVPILCLGGDHDPRSVCSRIGTPNVHAVTLRAGTSTMASSAPSTV